MTLVNRTLNGLVGRRVTGVVLLAVIMLQGCSTASGGAIAHQFTEGVTRPWVGPELWTNPMEDWQLRDGRIEVLRGGGNRNVHLLTGQIKKGGGPFEMSVKIGCLDAGKPVRSAGFRVGIKSELGDYRSALFFGYGINAGINRDGNLFFRLGNREVKYGEWVSVGDAREVELSLKATEGKDGDYVLKLSATWSKKAGSKHVESAQIRVKGARLAGNLALVNNYSPARFRRGQGGKRIYVKHWFDNWSVKGKGLVVNKDRAFGPILWAQHTLSRRIMKMTAQMPPVGKTDSQVVALETKQGGSWKKIGEAKIDAMARTATFRIAKWDDAKDTSYRLAYELKGEDGMKRMHYWGGTIRKNPVDKELVVAGFTGNTDPAFPNAKLAGNVMKHNPDVLLFTGDQLYEFVGGYGIHRKPVNVATLNYLRKWYMFGWAFRELMKDRPTLCLPDDHDVYQGNIWGNGGNSVPSIREHAQGGYAMDAKWVNMIQRTQTSHHPDAYDPTPIKQGITVYYGDMLYGRVSFAIIEDRKFKSGPEGKVNTWKGRPDHIKDAKIDTKKLDKPGLVLLGERQLKFLNAWAKDWRGADLKVVCSQTIFCNLANYHGPNKMFLHADLDSNGWPQTGRNKALKAFRKGFAFMYAGDQHLPSIVHHGVDAQGDSGFSFCVPSIAAGYPRSWKPDIEGKPVRNRPKGGLANTGDYVDGLGNLIRVHAIGNPAAKNRKGVLKTLHDKASGYGIVRFGHTTGKIKMECHRLLIDAANPKPGDQFPGWPKTISIMDNYGRRAVETLPTIKVSGVKRRPVIQVIDEGSGDVLYTLRAPSMSFTPKVFKKGGAYTVKVTEPDSGKVKVLKGVKAGGGEVEVGF